MPSERAYCCMWLCRKPAKPEPGRVTRTFLEFGSKDDWVSKTLLKHTLAAIIQASYAHARVLVYDCICANLVTVKLPSHALFAPVGSIPGQAVGVVSFGRQGSTSTALGTSFVLLCWPSPAVVALCRLTGVATGYASAGRSIKSSWY